jgi:prepilin-type N-terminal cleavage/methylation domain-containing protein
MFAKSTPAARVRRSLTAGFSLAEILVAVALLSIIAALAINTVGTTKTSVTNTKLISDVKKLNEVISVYLAEGGSLAGLTTAQQVLDRLKTVRSSTDTVRNVGVMTGRGVDVRLTAVTQTTAEAATSNARAVWNSATNQFVVATSGTGAVGSFTLNDALATATPVVDSTRTQSHELYNGSAGWVWASGTNTQPTALQPIDMTLTAGNTSVSSGLDPTAGTSSSSSSSSSTSTSSTSTSTSTSSSSSSSGTTTSGKLPSGSTAGVLPTPVITTPGGDFSASNFPSLVYIDSNAAPSSVSTLEYQINGTGPWITYTGPIAIVSGQAITAQNISSNTSLYSNSSTDTQGYYIIQSWFGGSVTAQWNASTGPGGFSSTRSNSNPLSVTETDGVAYSGSTNGKNSFNFSSSGTFTNIQPNTPFAIGQMVYHNGTINSGTGSTGLNLQLNITMSTPAIATTASHIAIALSNSTNTGNGNNAASADTATLSDPVTDYAVVVNGVTYTLVVSYGSIDSSEGYVSGNTLNVYEGATGTVNIVASFVSNH